MFDFFRKKFNKDSNQNSSQKEVKENISELMYPIDRPNPTQFFVDVRTLVGCWLQEEIKKTDKAHWLKTIMTYPCFEHLSIAYKNQIFCILIEIINENTKKSYLPEQYRNNLIKECNKNNLIPCIYKVYVNNPLNPAYNTLKPVNGGWNLYHAATGDLINIEGVVSDLPVVMSEWELHDFAIQIVRDYIVDQLHYPILSYQNIVGIDPQLWFEDENHNKKFVIVRYTKFPENKAQRPNNIQTIKNSCNGYGGYFASVAFHGEKVPDVLYRGDKAYIAFNGLEEI